MLPRLAGLLVVVLLASACGGSDDQPADAPSVADPTMSSAAASIIADLDYCEVAVAENSRAGAFDVATASPQETAEFYRSMTALADRADVVAPETIVDDLAVQRRALAATVAALEAVDWNLADVGVELALIYEDPEYLDADARLEEHAATECGIGAADAVPARFEAYCAVATEVAGRSEVSTGASPDEARTHYETLVADLDRLEASAPEEIVDSVVLVADRFDEVARLLERAAWDLGTGLASVEAWAADPAVSDPMNEAIAVIETFDTDVCGLAS
ncbi:MAG: hypothetical protein RIB98_12800 [Acidimicrobiales bacterium]